MEDSLNKRYSIKLFSNIIMGVIGAVLVAIVPNALGPVSYGHFVYLQDFFMKVIGFLDLGTSTAFFTKLSAQKSRKELIVFYFLYSSFVFLALFVLVFFIDFFSYQDVLLPYIPTVYIFMGLLFAFFTWLTRTFIKISDAYALTVSVELIKLTHKILSLMLLFYFIYDLDFNLAKYFYFHYISLFSFLLILTVLFIRKGIFKNFYFKYSEFKPLSKEFYTYCSPLFLFSLLGLISGFFDIWLLQKVSGSTETGFYGLSYSLAAMCFLFTSAMTPIITREFSVSYGKNDLKKIRALFLKYVPMLYAISAYFAVFISIQSENVLDIFTNEQFKGAHWALSIMAIYTIHQTYGQLSSSLFYATGQTRLMRNISFFTLPLGIFISFVLITALELGAVGLASKMVISQIIGVNIQLYFNAKLLNFKISKLVFHQIYVVLSFFILASISDLIVTFQNAYLNFLCSGVLYTIFVIIYTYIFPITFATTKEELKVLFRIRIK